MKHKPDAYELEYNGKPSNVIKCDECGFKAVKCQFDEEGKCPRCKMNLKIEKGHNKK